MMRIDAVIDRELSKEEISHIKGILTDCPLCKVKTKIKAEDNVIKVYCAEYLNGPPIQIIARGIVSYPDLAVSNEMGILKELKKKARKES